MFAISEQNCFFNLLCFPIKSVIFFITLEKSKKHFNFVNYFKFQDFFNIVLFDSETVLWKDDLVFATAENKADATEFVKRHYQKMRGGTDIKLAYSTAFDLLDPYITESCLFYLFIIFVHLFEITVLQKYNVINLIFT